VLRLGLGLELGLGLGSAKNEMKGDGSCALIITISDFRGPPK
jgi:hypothetical protein